MDPEITSDPIIDEIHATRRAMAEKFGGDLKAMLEDAKRRQEASGRPTWKPNTSAIIPIPGDIPAAAPAASTGSAK